MHYETTNPYENLKYTPEEIGVWIQYGEMLRQLKKDDPDKIRSFLGQLSEEEAQEILYNPYIILRPKQVWVPSPEKPFTMNMAGRGWGKTLTGAMSVYIAVEEYGVKYITLAGSTASDVSQTMIKGPSGVLSVYPDNHPNKPVYKAGSARLEWPNGAVGRLISNEAPHRAKGLNSMFVWMDEIASWEGTEFFDDLVFGLRLGMASAVITTTPRATPLVINLFERKDKDVKLVTGSSLENEDNLSEAFLNQLESTYAGTTLHRQEVLGELILRNENSLWSPEVIDRNKVNKAHLPDMEQYVIAVDPALSSNVKTSDATAIILVGMGADENIYILGDWTGHHQPHEWTGIIHTLYDRYSLQGPTTVVIESNALGHHTKNIITRDYRTLPVQEVKAVASKSARAAPVSLLWEQNVVKIVLDSGLDNLEREMLSWNPYSKKNAVDDRVDAMVYGVSHLRPMKRNFTAEIELLI